MRFWFNSRGKQTTLTVLPTYENDDSYLLCLGDKRSAYEARATATSLQRGLEARMEEIRSSAYAQGWRDAKAKRRKVRRFFSSMCVPPNGHCGW